MPLSVHSRNAGRHAIETLAEAGAARVCLHAFDGRAHYAVHAVEEHGYFFSIPPSVTRVRFQPSISNYDPQLNFFAEF